MGDRFTKSIGRFSYAALPADEPLCKIPSSEAMHPVPIDPPWGAEYVPGARPFPFRPFPTTGIFLSHSLRFQGDGS